MVLLVLAGGRRTFRAQVLLPPTGLEVVTNPFQLPRSWLGAPRIQLTVQQPVDTSSLINIALLNDRNDVVLSYYKETWRQTGRWNEGGESGRWDEQDSEIATEFRPGSTGQFRLRLSLEDYLSIAKGGANPSPQPGLLPVNVEIYANTLHQELLLATSVFLLIGVIFYLWFEYAPKRSLRRFSLEESNISQAMVCPHQALVEVKCTVRYEKTDESNFSRPKAPVFCGLNLHITNAWGETVLERCKTVRLQSFQIDEDDQGFRAQHRLYLISKTTQRLSFRVQAPESLAAGSIELERLTLILTELPKTCKPVTQLELV